MAPSFDGRSHSVARIIYTPAQRLVVGFSMKIMPLLTLLCCSDRVNTFLWRMLGCRIGHGSVIRTGTKINAPFMVSIGRNCSIHGHLKSRGGLVIGNGVELVEDVLISTQSHNMDSHFFESVYERVTIEDFVWLGPRSIVLPGNKIEKGCVLAAGAVATKSLSAWTVYGGVPAKYIKPRSPMLNV